MLLKWALAALRNADPLAVYQHDLAWITPAQTQRHTHTTLSTSEPGCG